MKRRTNSTALPSTKHMRALQLLTSIFSFLVLTSTMHAAEPASEFTSTAESKSKLLEEGNDSFKYRCKGLAGYDVIYEGGDGRSWINLVYDSEQTDLMNDTLNACPGTFPSKANDVVQWRGFRKGGTFTPYAIIYRMRSMNEESGKQTETLVILQLAGAGSRVVGKIPASKGNEAAEALADKLCARE